MMLFTAEHVADAEEKSDRSRVRPSAFSVVDAVRMMAKRVETVASLVLDVDTPETTVLDLFDRLLNSGVVADGDVTLGLAGVDLIYLRLSALLCAADRVLPRDRVTPRRRRASRRRAVKSRS
jgi:hypothetical protein